MSVILSALGWLVLLALAVLIILLVTPVRLSVKGEAGPIWRGRVMLAVLGGLVPPFAIYDSNRPRKPKEEKPKAKKPRRRSKRSKGRLAREIPGLVRDLLRCIRFDGASIRSRFGMPDPADTGALFGRLAPFLYGAPQLRRVEIDVRPDFNETVFEGQIEAAVRLTPVTLVPPVLRFALRAYWPKR